MAMWRVLDRVLCHPDLQAGPRGSGGVAPTSARAEGMAHDLRSSPDDIIRPDGQKRASKMGTMTNVIFVLSLEHSGSTWVSYVLGSSNKSAFLGEYLRVWDDENRVPCTLCWGRGLEACSVLHGAEEQPRTSAYAFASERLGRRVLVDCSKDLTWVGASLKEPNISSKIVVVIKDPRGWIQSVQRRRPSQTQNLLQHWAAKNSLILNFVQSAGVPSIAVSYDVLAGQPAKQFRRLFDFCGLPFDMSCLEYWKQEHHGFAANGATDALIKSAQIKSPEHFVSGDDTFYGTHSQRSFHDQRWREDLSPGDQKAILRSREAAAVLAKMKLRMTPVGIGPLGLLARFGAVLSGSLGKRREAAASSS